MEISLTPCQAQMWNCDAKELMAITGRRMGKTHLWRWELMDLAARHPGSMGGYIAPTFTAPTMLDVWDGIHSVLGRSALYERTSREEHTMFLKNRARIKFLSADDPERIRGDDFNLLIADEVSLCKEAVYINAKMAVGALDGRLILSSNVPELHHPGERWLRAKYNQWQIDPNARVFVFPSWENTAVFPGGRQDPKILEWERDLAPDIFARYVAADMNVMTGLIYPEFDPAKHVIDDYIPQSCYVSVDPGFVNPTSIHWYDFVPVMGGLSQKALETDGSRMHDPFRLIAFDELYRSGLTGNDIVAAIRAHPMQPIFVVYDAEDAALGEMLTRAGYTAIPSDKTNRHGQIVRCKNWFHMDRIYVCRKCTGLIDELRHYVWAEKTEIPIKKDDHAVDDLRQMVTAMATAQQEFEQYREPELVEVEADEEIEGAFDENPFG